ncbi:MAG: recombination protein O N-terminal domain-containing protein [Odoribacter splanchnicus]
MEIVQGIILKTSPYSETQKIIRIYTKEKGYLSMISPSVVFKRKTKTVHLLQISEIEFSRMKRAICTNSVKSLRSSTCPSYISIFSR